MPTIAVFGAEGQLGIALRERAAGPEGAGLALVPVPRGVADLTDPLAVRRALAGAGPDVVINAAAHNAVDAAETDVDRAFAVNATGAGHVARACAAAGIPLVHLSSDYVFPGDGQGLLAEDAPTGPLNVYGRSKLAGEELVLAASPRHLVVRTAWLFGPHRHNFVRTMLALARTRPVLEVVDDHVGTPTATDDLAGALLTVCRRVAGREDAPAGIFHFAGRGATSWHGLAEAVLAEAARHGAAVPTLRPIPGSARPTPARRPRNSGLACGRIRAAFGIEAPDWRPALARCVARLGAAAG